MVSLVVEDPAVLGRLRDPDLGRLRPASETWNHTFSTNDACLTMPSSVVADGTSRRPRLLLGQPVEQRDELQPVVVDERLAAARARLPVRVVSAAVSPACAHVGLPPDARRPDAPGRCRLAYRAGSAGARRSLGLSRMPESLTRDEVAHLADLARIDLTDAELDHLAPQLSVILESVASISGVAGDDVPPTSHALPLTNVFREDVVDAVPDPRAGALRRPGGRAAAVLRPADPGGRAVTRPASARPRPSWPTPRRRRDHLGRADPGPPRPDRRGRRRRARVPARRRRGRARQAAEPPTSAARPAAGLRAGRRADRGQGRAGHRGPAHHLRLEDPRGLDPAVRRDRGRQAARGRPADPRQDQHGRVRDGLLHRALGVRRRPTTRGTSTGSRAAPAAARPRRSPPSRRRSRSAPTPAARSASPAPSPAPSA